MADPSAYLNRIRQVRTKLLECYGKINNQQTQAEYQHVLTKLQYLENSLLVRHSLLAPSITSRRPISVQSFPVFAEQQRLKTPQAIRSAASARFPEPLVPLAVNSVYRNQQARQEAETQALVARAKQEVRSQIAGRTFATADELYKTILNMIIPVNTTQIDSKLIAEKVAEEFIREQKG